MLFRTVFLILCELSAVALADPAAEKLFLDGRAALTAGKVDEACDLFRRSDALEPRVGTILNLGDCEERRGHVATAWAAFFDAEGRAQHTNDPRAKEAAKRSTALAPRLPYLTIVVPPLGRTIGVRVRRNGLVVDPAEYERKLPFDPGRYRIEVDAPNYAPWHDEVTLVEGKETRVEVPPLVASAEPPPKEHRPTEPIPPVVIVQSSTPEPALEHRIGLGLLAGLSSDLDFIFGGRVVLNAAPLGRGVVRVIPSVMYTSYTDAMDPNHTFSLFAVGTTFEYAYPFTKQLVAAGGAGVGLDLETDSYDNPLKKTGWGAIRLSPTVRFERLDIGVHVQFVFVSGKVVTLAELGLDYFVW